MVSAVSLIYIENKKWGMFYNICMQILEKVNWKKIALKTSPSTSVWAFCSAPLNRGNSVIPSSSSQGNQGESKALSFLVWLVFKSMFVVKQVLH